MSTTAPVEDTTDFEITDDEAPGTLHWGNRNERESFSVELRDFHECILDLLTASIAEDKMEEINLTQRCDRLVSHKNSA